jgi:hypothetical protein
MTAIRTSIKTLALTFAIGLFATASPAVAATDVLSIDSATLVARGAAVDVTYSFVCDADTQVVAFVTVAQRNGRGVATGFGGTPFEDPIQCTGETQTATVRVIAQGGLAFKRGTALVDATLVSCFFEGPGGPEGPGGAAGPGIPAVPGDDCTTAVSEVITITR